MRKIILFLFFLIIFSFVFSEDTVCGWFCPPDGWSNYSDKVNATGCTASEIWKCADGGTTVVSNPGACINGTRTTVVQSYYDCSYTCPCNYLGWGSVTCNKSGYCKGVCGSGGGPCNPLGRFVPNTCLGTITTTIEKCGTFSLFWKNKDYSIIPINDIIKVQTGKEYKFSVLIDTNAGFVTGKQFTFTLYAANSNEGKQNIFSGTALTYSAVGQTGKFVDYNWIVSASQYSTLSTLYSQGYDKLYFNAYYSTDVNKDSGQVGFSIYGCTGGNPVNSVLCEGDDAITSDITSVLVSSCSSPPGSVPKCEYSCAPGFNYVSGTCVANNFNCTGVIPLNSVLCESSSDGLTQNTSISLVNSCSNAKCEYVCAQGYSFQGGQCVKNTFQCLGPNHLFSKMCELDDNGLTVDTYKTLVESCSSPVSSAPKCEMVCNSGFKRELVLGVWVCKIIEACNAADDDYDKKIDNGYECIMGEHNSNSCIQSNTICDNNKTGLRDNKGDCGNLCFCIFDNFEYSCQKNSCGAQCSIDLDCESGYSCNAGCVCEKISDNCLIEFFNVKKDIIDSNVVSSFSCLKKVDANLYFFNQDDTLLMEPIKVICGITDSNYINSILSGGQIVKIVLSTEKCSVERFISISKKNNFTIPDNNIFIISLLFFTILLLLNKKVKK